MRKVMTIIVTIALAALLAIPAGAQTEWDVSGQIRLRGLTEQTGFDKDLDETEYTEMRTRLGIRADIEGNVHAFIQLQDSRIWGDENQFGDRTSGTLSDSKNIDLHQAYFKIDNIFGEGWGGMGGRFEFNRGNQRVFGAVGWHNVGRAWEGSMLWYDRPNLNITGFGFKVRESLLPDEQNDVVIGGLYATIKEMNLDLFAFFEYDDRESVPTTDDNDLNRANLGMYYHRTSGRFDFDMNGVLQVGEMTQNVLGTEKLDIAAFLLTFEAGMKFEGAGNGRIAAAIDLSSGDDDPTDDKYNTYTNSYYTGHKFRGYMDYFVGSNTEGLMDVILRGKIDPIRGWTIKGDIHYFATAKDFVSPIDSSTTKGLGVEIDLSVSTTRVKGVNLVTGLSVFGPTEAYAGVADPEAGFWAYSQAIVNF